MHELSIAQALVERVEAVAARERATRVVRVAIVVGALSGVDPDALMAAFPLVAEGTTAAGAELLIERVPARVRCRACGHEAATCESFIGCAACGSRDVELVSGRELDIRSVELEVGKKEVQDVQ